MGYWFTRATAIIAVVFVAFFAVVLPFLSANDAFTGGPFQQGVGVVYVLLALLPHRVIVCSTIRYRVMMAFFLLSFVVFFTPPIFIQAVLIPSPVALMTSRFRYNVDIVGHRRKRDRL